MTAIQVINNDDDAWSLLAAWLDGEDPSNVEIGSWPVLSINISGDDYQSSLNSGQMSALVELKMAMGRAYSLIAHGAYDARKLRDDEDEQIQFSTKVKKGSSILDTDLSPLVQAFANAVTGNPSLAIAAAVVLGLALVSKPVIIKYYDERAKRLDVEERKRLLDLSLSKEEKTQYKVFEKAVSKVQESYPQFAQVIPDARESFWRFASASVDADRVSISGLSMSQDDLEILAERRKRRSGDVQEIVSICRVISVRKAGAGFKVGLESQSLSISADYRKPQLTDARIKRLFSCLTEGRKVKARVDVKTVDQAQLSGRLIAFTPVSDD